MNKHSGFAVFVFSLIITACTPSLRLNSGKKINPDCNQITDLHIFSKLSTLPKEYKVINRNRTQGNFLKLYNVDQSMNLIRKGVCSLGGNSVKIIDISSPSMFGSKSYDIVADVLHTDQAKDFNFSIVDNSLTIESQFFYLKIYRHRRIYGSGVSYPVYLGDEYLCSINDKSRITIKLKDGYPHDNFQIEFEGKRYPLQLNLRKGEAIYVNCKVGDWGIPVLKVLSDEEGIRKF